MNILSLKKSTVKTNKVYQKDREDHVAKYLKYYLKGIKYIEENFNSDCISYRRWMFEQLDLTSNMKVLDYGCWGGTFWKENAGALPQNLNCQLIDQSLINIRLSTQTLKSCSLEYDVKLMSFYELDYKEKEFDTIISDLGFILMQEKTQFVAFYEAYRVLKKGGKFYCLLFSSEFGEMLSQLLRDFDENIYYKTVLPQNISTDTQFEKALSPLYEDITFKRHVVEYVIQDARFFINLLINLDNVENFVDLVVKKHQLKEFEMYVQNIIEKENGIRLSREYTLACCTK